MTTQSSATPTILWIPGPLGPKLARYLEAHWNPVWVADSAEAAEDLIAEFPIQRIVTVYTDRWRDGEPLWAGLPHHAVLFPDTIPPEFTEKYPDCVPLTGSLPGNVAAWMQAVDVHTRQDTLGLTWDDDPEGTPSPPPSKPSLQWSEAAVEEEVVEYEAEAEAAIEAETEANGGDDSEPAFAEVAQRPVSRPAPGTPPEVRRVRTLPNPYREDSPTRSSAAVEPMSSPHLVPQPAPNTWNHHVIASFSTAGGVGKTTTASILARLLQETGRRVTIVEADEEKAGVLRMFGCAPASNGLDLIDEMIWRDVKALSERLQDIVVAVNMQSKGIPPILVYPLVGVLEGLRVPDREAFREFLRLLKKDTEYLIVDLPPRLRDEMAIATLAEADAVCFVYEPTEPNLDAATRHLHDIQTNDMFDRNKYALIINKNTPRALPAGEMTKVLQVPLLGVIPEESIVYHTLANTGRIRLPHDSPWRGVLQNLLAQLHDDLPADEPDPRSHTARRPKHPNAAAGSSPSFMRRVLGGR